MISTGQGKARRTGNMHCTDTTDVASGHVAGLPLKKDRFFVCNFSAKRGEVFRS
jgi:hypothetical protein